MSDIANQSSFNSGEWSPSLYARVDMQKYRSGAALLENWFVDYHGGVANRPGSKYVIQCRDSAHTVRLIPFQATATIGYVLEFGEHYIRFIHNGQPVLSPTQTISGATQANPTVLTIVGTTLAPGDWIYITGVVGMTQLNGKYYIVTNVAGNLVTISDLRGNPINSTAYSPYTSGGTAAPIYTLTSPYAGVDLALLKFAQNGGSDLILTHPGYSVRVLHEVTANNWTLTIPTFGTTAFKPTGLSAVTASRDHDLSHGSVNYAYVVTSIDVFGQESIASDPVRCVNSDFATALGPVSNTISWTPAVNADHYRIYRAVPSITGPVADGVMYGYEGFSRSATFTDTHIAPDYAQTPPIAKNPFSGNGVLSVAVTASGTYTTVPTVAFSGGSPSVPGVAYAILQVKGTPTIGAAGTGYVVGDTLSFDNDVVLVVATIGGGGAIATFRPITYASANPGGLTSGATPANPVTPTSTSGIGTGATANLTWGVGVVNISNEGSGYSSVPTVVFTPAGATGTAMLDPVFNGNPSVPAFFQQRLVLAAPLGAPQTLYMSQTGNYFNFNIHLPVVGDDAITATLVSSTLNTIKAMVPTTAGLLVLTDKASWLVNGGASGSDVKPSSIVANAQSFIGANDVPPIVANYDILYVQQKGSSVRDLSFNIYYSVFTGNDISIISSHLFQGHQILEWAWAEEPYKVVWAVRDDGVMLTLTFMKEQEFIGWAHQTTQGLYRSTTTVSEVTDDAGGEIDAVYNVVDRVVGGQTWKYIERVAERLIHDMTDSHDWWFVDCGLQYRGAPATTFSGGEHLAGLTVTGLADGIVIPPFVMPTSGSFTLATPASVVTIGLGYTSDLQTLPLDIGSNDSIQGKVKKIPFVDVKVEKTLGLRLGPDFTHLSPMKDLIRGNVSSMKTGLPAQITTGLYTGDARMFISSGYTVPGQYCIRQSDPLPATVLGVFPSVIIGDDK